MKQLLPSELNDVFRWRGSRHCSGIVGIHNLRVERESGASLDALYRFAGNPATDDEDRCIYQVIANSLVGDVDELVAETERLERSRRFEVITGGAARLDSFAGGLTIATWRSCRRNFPLEPLPWSSTGKFSLPCALPFAEPPADPYATDIASQLLRDAIDDRIVDHQVAVKFLQSLNGPGKMVH